MFFRAKIKTSSVGVESCQTGSERVWVRVREFAKVKKNCQTRSERVWVRVREFAKVKKNL